MVDAQGRGDHEEGDNLGILTRKTQRQPATPRMLGMLAKKPPTAGPSTLDVPKVAVK
jgi:hypothetical protein